jgi:hypothetical protein
MKTIRPDKYLWILLSTMILGCVPDSDEVKERPDNIIATKPCSTLYRSIMDMFPEYKNNQDKQPILFSDDSQKQVVLTKESDVYLTFISEGAGYSNTFGYYTYDVGNPPQSKDDIKMEIIFPNVSDRILNQGDRLRLGDASFKAGTVIGFFLIFQGWDHGSINYDRTTIYTDHNLNPSGHQQHIFFKQKDCGDYVLAFEDQPLDDNSDFDFNDMIFTVSDNTDEHETVSFDTTNLPNL